MKIDDFVKKEFSRELFINYFMDEYHENFKNLYETTDWPPEDIFHDEFIEALGEICDMIEREIEL